MKFKKFIKKKYHPIPILQTPCHGAHSKPIEEDKAKEEKLTEATHALSENELRDLNMNGHIGHDHAAVNEHLSSEHDIGRDDNISDDERKALLNYTDHSRSLNNNLITSKKAGKEPGELDQKSKDMLAKHPGYNHKNPLPYSHPDYDDHEDALYRQQDTEYIKKRITHLDSALAKGVNKRKNDLHVFHGLTMWHPGKEAAKHPDRKIQLPAYTSTSINPDMAANFAHPDHVKPHSKNSQSHILHIHVKPEHKGLYLGKHTMYEGEHEFLLPRNTILQIHKKPTVYTKKSVFRDETGKVVGHHVHRTHMWHADIVGHDDDDK